MTQIVSLLPYMLALFLTLLIEGSLCFLLLKNLQWLKFTCLVNLFTNPLLNFVYAVLYFFLRQAGFTGIAPWLLLFLEILVWLSEAWLFFLYGKPESPAKASGPQPVSTIYKALLFSLVLNAASYLSGLLLKL